MIRPDHLRFSKENGLLPAIIQDAHTLQVLMLGYMNSESLMLTQELGKVTFFSRSKNRLWTKGEESGNFLWVQSIQVDCDQDTLLIQALPQGPTCHKGTHTCWGDSAGTAFGVLKELEFTLNQRWNQDPTQSYVANLRQKGIPKIAQKVGEEAVEVVIEAMGANPDLFQEEGADLFFHFLVLLKSKGFSLDDILQVLAQRRKPNPSDSRNS